MRCIMSYKHKYKVKHAVLDNGVYNEIQSHEKECNSSKAKHTVI